MRIGSLLTLPLAFCACQVVLGEDFSQTQRYCDPPTNAGCAVGEACAVGSDLKPRCVAAGTAAPGASCAQEACAPGATCWTIDGVARCLAYCDTAAPSCVKGHCGSLGTIDGQKVGVCFANCDLSSPRGGTAPFGLCPTGKKCIESGIGTACIDSAGTQDDGESCLAANQICRPGLSCSVYTKTGEKFCEPYCRYALGGADCPGGRKCSRFASGLTIDGIEFGSCDR